MQITALSRRFHIHLKTNDYTNQLSHPLMWHPLHVYKSEPEVEDLILRHWIRTQLEHVQSKSTAVTDITVHIWPIFWVTNVNTVSSINPSTDTKIRRNTVARALTAPSTSVALSKQWRWSGIKGTAALVTTVLCSSLQVHQIGFSHTGTLTLWTEAVELIHCNTAEWFGWDESPIFDPVTRWHSGLASLLMTQEVMSSTLVACCISSCPVRRDGLSS